MKLSVCLATFNEEPNIHYSLGSVVEFADEIIVVDGGSTDETVARAKEFGKTVRVIETINPPMFHINKQKAIEEAKGEWILQLDADEEVTPKLRAEIMSIVNSENQSIPVGYWVPRLNLFLNRFLTKGGVYPDYTIRLYKNGVAHFPCKSVHENVEIKGEVGTLKADLLHFADPDFARYLTRWIRYSKLEAMQLVEKGEQLSAFNYLVWKPKLWFLNTYFRHRGYADGFPGFVFHLFSALRFIVIYVFVWQERHKEIQATHS